MRRILLALVMLLAFASLGSDCYDRPTCSFRCGPDNSCPYEYACAPDGWCKLKGADPSEECTGEIPYDAAPPDAEPDAGE